MKTANISIAFVILIVTLFTINISYGESVSVTEEKQTWDEIKWKVSNITIEEAKIIRQIESLVDRYNDPNYKEKQEILDSMCEIYKEYQTTFLGIVLLNNVMCIERLDILPEPQTITEREFLTFARLMQNSEDEVLPYLSNIKNPGLKGFLMVWYAEQKSLDNLPKELRLLRKAKVEQSKSQIQIQIKDISHTEKVKLLFNTLENWESPLQYEACIPLIIEEYERNPELVLRQLKKQFLKHIPSQIPPPYLRDHTILHEICFVAIAINDKTLIDIILPFANSTNSYVAITCSEVLKWLRENMKYPVKYKYLKWAYDSRS